jgi:hypothetical protein
MNNDEDMTTRRVEIQAKATTNYQYNHPEGLRRPEMSHNSAQQFGPSNTAVWNRSSTFSPIRGSQTARPTAAKQYV